MMLLFLFLFIKEKLNVCKCDWKFHYSITINSDGGGDDCCWYQRNVVLLCWRSGRGRCSTCFELVARRDCHISSGTHAEVLWTDPQTHVHQQTSKFQAGCFVRFSVFFCVCRSVGVWVCVCVCVCVIPYLWVWQQHDVCDAMKWFSPHIMYVVYFLCGLVCTCIHESDAELICMCFSQTF